MNNLSPYCGLVDAKIRASDKDLPVTIKIFKKGLPFCQHLFIRFNRHVITYSIRKA